MRRISGPAPVYNIACPPLEAYIANGIAAHNCHFCLHRREGHTSHELFWVTDKHGKKSTNPARMIPGAKCREILDDAASMGVKAVHFTGGGEPTIHPEHFEVFKYASDLGVDVALVTHGALLRENVIQLFAERGSWVRVSVDAGKPETYSAVRKVPESQFHDAFSNIRKLADARKRDEFIVGVAFTVAHDNFTEVVECGKRARDAGAQSFRISAVIGPEGNAYFDGWGKAAETLCEEAAELSAPGFEVFNAFPQRANVAAPDYKTCHYQHLTTYIGGDLNVYRCCQLSYNPRGLIGSIADRKFSDLWFSSEKAKLYGDDFDARGCPHCSFNEKNRRLHWAATEPIHVNFP